MKVAYTKTIGINSIDARVSLDEIIELFRKADLKLLMEKDYERWTKFSDEITIYRGTSDDSREKGISWTIDRKRAIWFYKKYKSKGKVLKAKIKKKDILCFLDQSACFEKEVIVNYKNIFNCEKLSKDEIDKDINFEDLESLGGVNTDYVIQTTQALLQQLVNFGVLPTKELALEIFQIYQTRGKYKSKYILRFISGESIELSQLLEMIEKNSVFN